jgi:hypothetical protein
MWFNIEREILAYAIMGTIALIAIPTAIATLRRQKRVKLRRRGIKTHGH